MMSSQPQKSHSNGYGRSRSTFRLGNEQVMSGIKDLGDRLIIGGTVIKKNPRFRKGVFISYSHRDKAWLDRLQTMLKPIVRNKAVETWDDTQISAGEDWAKSIDKAISAARVAILLVTPNFLASEFIASHELPKVLAAQ